MSRTVDFFCCSCNGGGGVRVIQMGHSTVHLQDDEQKAMGRGTSETLETALLHVSKHLHTAARDFNERLPQTSSRLCAEGYAQEKKRFARGVDF